MNSQKVCITCGQAKRAKDFRQYRKSCRSCCYEKQKNHVIAWKNGRQEYVNAQYTAWRKKHPLSRKLSMLRARGYRVKGLLSALESLYGQHPWCEYCGIALNTDEVSLDHKTPMSRGGAACDPGNWAICCKDCNALKGGKTYAEFKVFASEYARRLLANTGPSQRDLEGATVRGEIIPISAPALD